jgi:hypothetical protein
MADKTAVETPGIAYSKQVEADYYTGTQRALIACGICKPAWFPAKLGKDHMGRTKRTYTVEGHKPEITLRHRKDSRGRIYWEVQMGLSDVERRRRLDERDAEWRRQERETEKRQQEDARGRNELRPVVAALEARYRGVRILDASYSNTNDPDRQQNLTYYAPLEVLKRYGLITEAMLVNVGEFRVNSIGDSFRLAEDERRSGCWILHVYTGSAPRGPMALKGISVAEAKRELRRIAAMD